MLDDWQLYTNLWELSMFHYWNLPSQANISTFLHWSKHCHWRSWTSFDKWLWIDHHCCLIYANWTNRFPNSLQLCDGLLFFTCQDMDANSVVTLDDLSVGSLNSSHNLTDLNLYDMPTLNPFSIISNYYVSFICKSVLFVLQLFSPICWYSYSI